MPIANYSTDVPVDRTVAEIQKLLMKANARRVMVEYENQAPTAMTFQLDSDPYMLPCRVGAVHKLLQEDAALKPAQKSRQQAERVAWRILRDWIRAQLAIIETGMVNLDEVMMPYAVVRPGKTMYEVYREERSDRLLTADRKVMG